MNGSLRAATYLGICSWPSATLGQHFILSEGLYEVDAQLPSKDGATNAKIRQRSARLPSFEALGAKIRSIRNDRNSGLGLHRAPLEGRASIYTVVPTLEVKIYIFQSSKVVPKVYRSDRNYTGRAFCPLDVDHGSLRQGDVI